MTSAGVAVSKRNVFEELGVTRGRNDVFGVTYEVFKNYYPRPRYAYTSEALVLLMQIQTFLEMSEEEEKCL